MLDNTTYSVASAQIFYAKMNFVNGLVRRISQDVAQEVSKDDFSKKSRKGPNRIAEHVVYFLELHGLLTLLPNPLDRHVQSGFGGDSVRFQGPLPCSQ